MESNQIQNIPNAIQPKCKTNLIQNIPIAKQTGFKNPKRSESSIANRSEKKVY